ncbi:MAG: FAD-dependent oxidoreductase, partial [Burkholderiaceae bacterium]
MNPKKLAVLAILALAVAAFFVFDLGRYFSLAYIKESQASFKTVYAERPVMVTLVFFAAYVAITALSLPGAAIMTLASGASFGLVWGTIVVSLASTLGATLAMLAARTVLREAIEKRFGKRLAEVNKGVEKEGAFYLFTLRLIPAIPFFALNLLMGLTRMKTWTFFWVSQIGMLAGTVAYVYAGTEIGKIDSLHAILSPGLIGAFMLLGLLPLLTKRVVDAVRRRKVFARWKHMRPTRFDRNLIVIGAGAGGLVSALIGAAVKAQVTLVESHKMGGDCLNFGCVPSKALIKTAKLRHQILHSANYGLAHASTTFSFREVMARVHKVIAEIAPHDSVERYAAMGVDVQLGHARITSPWTVEITRDDGSKHVLTTRSIVIAAGARPMVPELPGLQSVDYVTSDSMWDTFAQLDTLPQRMVVLGGGPIGCELAQAFARLGADVTQIEMAERIMSREDTEVSEMARLALQADGVRVLTGHKALRCALVDTRKTITLEHQGQEVVVEFDALICAVGRVARLTGYGLEELGIPAQRTVETNAYLQTLYPNIYAAG